MNSWSTYIWVIKGSFDQDQFNDIETVLLETIVLMQMWLRKGF